MLKQPDILILDEATSALDKKTEAIAQKNIDTLRKGKTTIIVAHRLSTIQNADLIFVMDQGKIVAKGKHKDLWKTSDIYRGLYQNLNK